MSISGSTRASLPPNRRRPRDQQLSIEGGEAFGVLPDASLADPTSSVRLPTPLDAPDIEQRIDKGLTAAGEQSAFPPDYAYGAFQRGWFLTAFARALDRATQGDAAAQTLLGELLSRGLGVKQDLAAAADWYRLAADNGDAEAQYALGRLYLEGQVLEQDYAKAADYFEMAAEPGPRGRVARVRLPASAGQRVARSNALLAAAYLRRAARLGDMDAQYALAGLYVEGVGVVADEALAARWFGEAARNGHVGAQVEYAIMLFNGRGVPKDEAVAARWFERGRHFRQSARAGSARRGSWPRAAASNQNPAEAARWYMIAGRAACATSSWRSGWRASTRRRSTRPRRRPRTGRASTTRPQQAAVDTADAGGQRGGVALYGAPTLDARLARQGRSGFCCPCVQGRASLARKQDFCGGGPHL